MRSYQHVAEPTQKGVLNLGVSRGLTCPRTHVEVKFCFSRGMDYMAGDEGHG